MRTKKGQSAHKNICTNAKKQKKNKKKTKQNKTKTKTKTKKNKKTKTKKNKKKNKKIVHNVLWAVKKKVQGQNCPASPSTKKEQKYT